MRPDMSYIRCWGQSISVLRAARSIHQVRVELSPKLFDNQPQSIRELVYFSSLSNASMGFQNVRFGSQGKFESMPLRLFRSSAPQRPAFFDH